MSDLHVQLADNVADVRRRIAEAAARSGRGADSVRLVAVTKYVTADVTRALVAAGCQLLGESRPQQLWQKAAEMSDLPVRWHMIGHLQRNKAARTVPLVDMIESVDSPRLVEALDEAAASLDRPLPILLEVNVSGETAKHGLMPDEVEPLVARAGDYPHLSIRGLMCMAGLEGDLDDARREFASLRELRDRLRPGCPDGVALDELSMGMSGDYEVAIEEGATLVRVGSALFEGVR